MQQKLILSQAISAFSSCSKSVFSLLDPHYRSLCMFALWSGLPKLGFSARVQTDTLLALFPGPDFCPEIFEVYAAAISQPENKNSPSPDLNICRLERIA